MGFLDFLFGFSKPKNKKKQQDFNWETHCESCGELLEDCTCDWQAQSKQDISQSFWGENKKENNKTSFDEFNSFDDGNDEAF